MAKETTDRIVRVYFKIRDARQRISKEFKEQDDALKDQQEALEAELLGRLNAEGVSSTSGEGFTVYKRVERKFNIADESRFYPWALENEALDMFQKRLATGEITKYIDRFGDVPPGINAFSEVKVRINRK